MIFERHFVWPSRWPTSKTGFGVNGKINRVVKSWITNDGKNWLDPMCGRSTLTEHRNDFRKTGTAAITNMDALEYLKTFATESIDGVLYDPPYNDKQGEQYSKNNIPKSNLKYWWSVRHEISRVLKPGGRIIMLNWNSNTFSTGRQKNFQLEAVYLFAHGSERHDTILTVWKKDPNGTLFT